MNIFHNMVRSLMIIVIVLILKKEKKFNKITFFSKYRKPNPGMIKELAKKYKIDLKKSFVVGDSDKDILAGFKCKCKNKFL